MLKCADMHFLVENTHPSIGTSVTVAGVVKVKSGQQSMRSMLRQLDRHVLRSGRGLRANCSEYTKQQVAIDYGPDHRVFRVTVKPSSWRLPRTFRFAAMEQSRILHVDPGIPSCDDDKITHMSEDHWHVELKWSREAIAEAAYEMTFWYMEEVGEIIYSQGVPAEWKEMTPAEAGRNAVEMMLYYAILRCRTDAERGRAIALYNSYGYGYALGMNYRNSEGRREMLWPRDLDEILAYGKTKSGCTFR